MTENQDHMIPETVGICIAYFANNPVPQGDLAKVIQNVHGALTGLGGAAAVPAETTKATPADIKKSITRDHLISFEDGKPYKTLRRHLTLRGLTPEAYRAKHGLPLDYPMTSAAYSEQRSQLAKDLGLGQQRRKGLTAVA